MEWQKLEAKMGIGERNAWNGSDCAEQMLVLLAGFLYGLDFPLKDWTAPKIVWW